MKSVCIKEGDVEFWVLESSRELNLTNGGPWYKPHVWTFEEGPYKDLSVCKYGILHRLDGPAYTGAGGETTFWCKNGKLHRDDGPAVNYIDSSSWYRNGICHREGGPARVTATGEEWFVNGKYHRDGGPAITKHMFLNSGIAQQWYQHGALHRLDGPATVDVHKDNPKEILWSAYYVNDIQCYKDHEYEKAVARWTSYKDVTREEISSVIGKFKIVEWK